MTNRENGGYDVLLYAVGLAFMEIRATDDLDKARALADIFHNAPAKMRQGVEYDKILHEIKEKSSRHQLDRLAASMFRDAKKHTA